MPDSLRKKPKGEAFRWLDDAEELAAHFKQYDFGTSMTIVIVMLALVKAWSLPLMLLVLACAWIMLNAYYRWSPVLLKRRVREKAGEDAEEAKNPWLATLEAIDELPVSEEKRLEIRAIMMRNQDEQGVRDFLRAVDDLPQLGEQARDQENARPRRYVTRSCLAPVLRTSTASIPSLPQPLSSPSASA